MKRTNYLLAVLLFALANLVWSEESSLSCQSGIDPLKDPWEWDVAKRSYIIEQRKKLSEATCSLSSYNSLEKKDTQEIEKNIKQAEAVILKEISTPYESLSMADFKKYFIDCSLRENDSNAIDEESGDRAGDILMNLRRPILQKKLYDLLDDFNRNGTAGIDRVILTNYCPETWRWLMYSDGIGPNYAPQEKIGCSWHKTNDSIDSIDDSTSHRFWWYAGNQFIDEIWNEWYSCWKQEKSRSKPRDAVLGRLANDIGYYLYYVAPKIVEAVRQGDEKLAMAFKRHNRIHPWTIPEDKEGLMLWWEANKDMYPIGYTGSDWEEKAIASETAARDIFGKGDPEAMAELIKECKEYYAKPANERKSIYWYHFLEDCEDDIDSLRKAFHKATIISHGLHFVDIEAK